MRPLVRLLPTLLVFGCWGPKDTALFSHDPSAGGSSEVMMQAGSSPDAGGSSGAPVVGGSGTAPSTTTGGTSEVTAPTLGGSAGQSASGNDTSGAPSSAGKPPLVVESCDMVADSIVSDENGHCYRAELEELSFAAARDKCSAAGGHLVTIATEAENAFVRDMHDDVHWLGASDGKGDEEAGVGPYQWVTKEPFDYSYWEDGQPNAFETDCPSEDSSSDCFEHCAFQTDEGDWNDRSCWHTIPSICEWDVQPAPGAGGAGGSEP